MKNRRGFLVALSGISGAVAVAPLVAETAAPAAAAAPEKAPSAAALAIAATFRAFDARLRDADLTAIARGIDESRAAGVGLNPATHPLANSDEMVVRFAAGT
jgi:hypothetical protein